MNVNRRGFLSSILALATAPAIVRADSLMRVIPMEAPVLLERDLVDFIYELTPKEAPFITVLGWADELKPHWETAIKGEWLEDALLRAQGGAR